MKFKTPWNKSEFPVDKGEVNTQPSQTVPDQTLSLKELLDRYARGLPIVGEKFPIYNGDEEDLPDLKKMDLSEIADLKEKLDKQIKEQQGELLIQQHAETKKQNEIEQRKLFKKWQDEETMEEQAPKPKLSKKPD